MDGGDPYSPIIHRDCARLIKIKPLGALAERFLYFFDCGGVYDAVDVVFLNAAQLICGGHNASNANFRADKVVNGMCGHEHGVYGKVSIALIYRDAKGATALERLSCSALGTRR